MHAPPQLRQPPAEPTPPAWWRQIPARSIVLLGVVFAAVFVFPFFRKGDRGDWAHCYVPAAQRMLQGEVIHRTEPWQYAYPPSMAMFSIPLVLLPPLIGLGGWYVANLAALAVVVVCAWRLSGGPSITNVPRRWQAIFWIAMLLSARYLVAPLENYQFDLIIAACLFAGCWQLARGRDLMAGLWLGAATAMKCTPLLFAPYLLWRGKWKTVAALLLAATTLNALPELLWPQTNGGSYNADWFRSTTTRVGTAAPGEWFSDTLLNQSLAGLFNRFAVIGLPLSDADLAQRTQLLPDRTINLLRLLVPGTGLLVTLVTIAMCGGCLRSAAPFPQTDGYGRQDVDFAHLRTAIECAMVCCLMLLLSPMSSKHHYVVLFLPVLLLSRRLCEQRTPALIAIAGLLLLFGPLTAKDLIGRSWGNLMLAWGLPTYFVLACLAAMWLLVRQLPGWSSEVGSTIPATKTSLSRAA